MYEKYIKFLLDEAAPSIKYRVRRELLDGTDSVEAKELEALILEDPLIRTYIEAQEADGWINEDFHSAKGIETAIRVFCEKGLDGRHPLVRKMLTQLEMREDNFDEGCLVRVGKYLDELHLGGSQLIRAVIFVYAGVENKTFIQREINKALSVFETVISTHSIEEIIIPYKGQYVFKPKVKWPSIYHLRLLAFSRSWRSNENLKLMVDSIRQLIKLSPIPNINGRYKSQIIAPASFCMHDFDVDMEKLGAIEWMMWFHRMELLARVGVVGQLSELKGQLTYLNQRLYELKGIFDNKITHSYFTKWGTYQGLALEKNWRTKKRYLCDLIFRSLLINYYSREKIAPNW